MKIWLLAVGRTGRLLESAVAEYASRAQRYWNVEVIEVKEERAGRGNTDAQIREAEGERLLRRAPAGAELIALTRTGDAWDSRRLAQHLEQKAVQGTVGVAFVIGGALGLADSVLQRADRQMQLSGFTLPHDLARLMLFEQLYRAGTIVRGEPYHKGAVGP